MGDATSTIGLVNKFGDEMSSARQRNLHFMDESSGREKTFAGFLGSPGTDETFLQQPDGFIVMEFIPTGPAYVNTFHFDHDGRSTRGPDMQGKPAVKEAALGGALFAGDFNALNSDLNKQRHQACFLDQNVSTRWCMDLASRGTVFGLGTDASNRSIVITDGGSGNISAQWFDVNGTALTGAFTIITAFRAGANTWFETAALIGGDVAVRRVDLQKDPGGRDYTTSQWLVTVKTGQSSAQAAPQWLTSRPSTNLAIARSGKAYAMLPLGAPNADCAQKVEILAPDGTSCGSFDAGLGSGQCRTEDLALTKDDTPIQLLPKDPATPSSCSWRWWPGALH
jgi:hypothetical protein